MNKPFDTNLAFKLLGLFLGDYDGHQFKSNRTLFNLLYLYSIFWSIYILFNISRQIILIILPGKTIWSLYLGDIATLTSSNYYRSLLIAGPLFNFWMFCIQRLFHRIHSTDGKNRFWLR